MRFVLAILLGIVASFLISLKIITAIFLMLFMLELIRD